MLVCTGPGVCLHTWQGVHVKAREWEKSKCCGQAWETHHCFCICSKRWVSAHTTNTRSPARAVGTQVGTDTIHLTALWSKPLCLVPSPDGVFLELKSHPQLSFLARPSRQLWPLPHGALIHTPLSFLDPTLATSPATPSFGAPPLSAPTQPRPPASASHPSGAPPGGGEGGGGARSSSGPKVAPRARTAGPGAGARPATRPRCWSRKRSVSAWCSGSVGGSSAGPTGPAASADRWPGGG